MCREGRYIGGVRDKSAPTGCVDLHYQARTERPVPLEGGREHETEAC